MRESVNVTPRVFRDAMDDIAVEASLMMKKRGMRLCDVRDRMKVSDKRANAISRYLRGSDHPVGIVGAVKLAEAMKVPIRILVGEEAVLHPERPRRRKAPRPVWDGQLALPLDIVEYHP
ncbi:hypothetical protein [Aureimonas ureilytica]|nr:hypothetical protein [Aureimonas ureilytica]